MRVWYDCTYLKIVFKTRVPDNFKDKNICSWLRYVGLTLAISMAEVGFNVWGVEKIKDTVDKLKGLLLFYEPKLKKSWKSFQLRVL